MNKELVEYYWNETTECGEFVYESPTGFENEIKPQPLHVETPTKEKYWSELLWYLNTQGVAMNEKQAKLMRYFVKHTGDMKLAAFTMAGWPHMNHKSKGKITRWMRKVIATMIAIKDEKRKYEERAKIARLASNLNTLKGFTV